MANTGPENLATAGAKDNNCLLNCFTHNLFSLTAEKLQPLTQAEPFKALLDEFQNYYDLEHVSAEDLIDIDALLDSPYDREIIWGPVLRKYIEKLEGLSDSDRRDLLENKELRLDLMVKLTKHFGVKLTIHNSYDGVQDPSVYDVDSPFFSMVLYHSQKGGGHYDFIFPDDSTGEKARAHNAAFEEIEIETDIDGHTVKEKLSKPVTSQFYDVSMTDGIKQREAAIKKAVAEYVHGFIDERLQEAKPKAITPLHEATMQTQTANQSPKAVLVAKQRKIPKSDLRTAPLVTVDSADAEPRVGVRFETPLRNLKRQSEELEDSYEIRAKKHAKQSKSTDSAEQKEKPKMLIDEATGFPKAFIERLPVLFPDQDWDRDLKKDKIGIAHKSDGRNIQIIQDPQKEEVTFKSGKGSVKDMLKCAKAYEEATSVEYVLEYELKASSEEQALKFMQKMKESGLNVLQLKDISIQGKKLDPGKLEALVEQVVPRPKPTSTPRPSFGSQGGGGD